MKQLKIVKQILDHEFDLPDSYLDEIEDTPSLNPLEVAELLQWIKAGDEGAPEKFIQGYRKQVASIAQAYQNNGLNLQELIDLGNIGLIKAAQQFDESDGIEFLDLGVWGIRNTIIEALPVQTGSKGLTLDIFENNTKYAFLKGIDKLSGKKLVNRLNMILEDFKPSKIIKPFRNPKAISTDEYLHTIEKIETLTVEEELVLLKRIKAGDRDALEKLTRANLRYVVSVALAYQNNGLSLSTLIDEGNIGLIKGAQQFDETCRFQFIVYAVWQIRESILRALAENYTMIRINIPPHKSANLN